METLLEELKRYVGFDAVDEAALRELHPLAAPQFTRIADVFYRRILEHAHARTALEGGESQVGHLKVTLIAWMDSLLTGPWGEAYYERRARIGRVHVKIALPQHYMMGAMNIVRREFNALIDEAVPPVRRAPVRSAIEKVLDLELAIMLHTYREDLLSQAARVERLATFGQLVGSIGHELRNPLAVIESSLFILRGRAQAGDERVARHLDRIGEQLGLANGIVSSLLDMIRERPLERRPVKLGELAASVREALPRPEGVELVFEGVDALPEVQGDPTQLRQVLVNLLGNAIEATGTSGRVALRGTTPTPESIQLEVEDSGPGLDRSVRERLFEPLVTTKAKGIGLGLALVRRIVERHGGAVRYADATPHGARFLVTLPLSGRKDDDA